MKIEDEIEPSGEVSKKERNNPPYLTGTIDLYLLPTLQVALWLQDDRGGNKPALKGSLRRETSTGYWKNVGEIALWKNTPGEE